MIIGLCGRAGAGKDLVAKIVTENHPDYKQYALAQPIKEACNMLFGWDERHSYGELKEVEDPFWGFSPRHAYQTLGTEWGREQLRGDLWIKRAEMVYRNVGNLIISDVRFENEAEFIFREGGYLIQIDRPNQKNIELNTHVSEAGVYHMLRPEDFVLINDGSIPELRESVNQIMSQIEGNRVPCTH